MIPIGQRQAGGRVGDLDEHPDGGRRWQVLEELADRRDGSLVAREQVVGRPRVDRVAPAGAGHRDPVAGRAAVAQAASAPPSWTTTSTSSVSATGSRRRGVSARMTGRVPSGRRNSLPFHVGITSPVRPGGGSSRRTLAAGSSIVKPASSALPTVTRTSRGVRATVPCTATVRNAGGSRRTLLGGPVAVTLPAPGGSPWGEDGWFSPHSSCRPRCVRTDA